MAEIMSVEEILHLELEPLMNYSPPEYSIKDVFSQETTKHGTLGIGTGMKGCIIGAFTRMEDPFIQSIYRQKNASIKNPKILYVVHSKNKGLVSMRDVHLFCGSSDIGTYRIDINSNSSATHSLSVKDFIRFCVLAGITFDIICIDPPYNKRYDIRYNTHSINNIVDGGVFLADIVQEVLKILAPQGILISKNWRSIRPKNCRFISGIITFYGGFRRATILEAWEFCPSDKESFNFDWNNHESYWGQHLDKVSWILGEQGRWSASEISMVERNLQGFSAKNGVFISDSKNNPFKFKLKIKSVTQFLNSQEKFDLIILDSCKKIGGAVKMTAQLKNHIPDRLELHGKVITKTYFDPVLQQKGLELLSRSVVCYDNYGKIDIIHIYNKN